MNLSNTAASQNYSAQGQMAGAAPKEIGLMTRMDCITGGLASLQEKAENLIGRLVGQGVPTADKSAPPIVGMPGLMSCAEDRLRRLHQLMDGMNDAF